MGDVDDGVDIGDVGWLRLESGKYYLTLQQRKIVYKYP